MRVWRRGAGLLALAALLVPAGSGARADELLVMPYACAMVGGQPVLTLGPEQSHRIIGPRDQRKFNACSPVNPDMCRQWTVHRFDLDCDGARVPWVSVVAATNEGTRRAWLLDGRLVLRMGPRWSLRPDNPCAREADPDDRAGYRRMRRYCSDQLALAPPAVVEMPFGYAPMLGIDGIFVKTAPGAGSGAPPLPPVSAAPPMPKSAGAGPLHELFASSEPPAAEVPQEPAAREPPIKAAPAVPPPVAAAPPQPAPKAAAPPPVSATPPRAGEPPRAAPPAPARAAATAEAPRSPPAEARPAPPGPNLGPRPISPPKPAPAATTSPAPPTAAEDAMASGSGSTTASKTETSSAGPKDVPRSAAPGPNDGGSGVSVLGVFRATTTGAIVAFAGLALGLLTAFGLARRREHAHEARRRPRDLSAVSFDGRRAKPGARVASPRGTLVPNAAPPAPAQAAGSSPPAGMGDRMPRTRAEAMQVLGMGVAPSATEAALKKIVDGLRQSWHPDLAKDDADRILRELRCRQINVAWDLLRGQRAEV
ncbi:MAG TPA: hypothetical protein VGF29_01645 [Hyphomicrobiaceae bacterium]|jgi:hypothetical protein